MMGEILGFQAGIALQAAVWLGLWFLGILLTRIPAGAARRLAWTLALAGILLLPLASWQGSRILPTTGLLQRMSAPSSALQSRAAFPGAQPLPASEAKEAQPASSDGKRSAATASSGTGAATQTMKSKASPVDLPMVLASVWLGGVALMLARLLLSLMALGKLNGGAGPVRNAHLQSLLRSLKEEMGIRRDIRLKESPDVASPVSFGIFHPVIMLPACLSAAVAGSSLRSILIHELAHVRNRDFCVSLLQRLLEALLFYHPAVWLASRSLSMNQEHACDDWVLSMGSDRREYALCLVDVMKPCAIARPRIGNALFGFTGRLGKRIKLIAEKSRSVTPVVSRSEKLVLCFAALLGILPVGVLFSQAGGLSDAIDVYYPDDYGAAWSPDGNRIAFISDREASWDVYTMDPDGKNTKRLTTGIMASGSVSWSPDGKKLTFAAGSFSKESIFAITADGSSQKNLVVTEAPGSASSWSPDGKRIAFTSSRDGNREIYVMNTDGTRQTRLTKNDWDDSGPAWSPDGGTIAFASNQAAGSMNYNIFLMSPDGTNQRQLTDDSSWDFAPAFSPDGKRLAYASTLEGDWAIHAISADGNGGPTRVGNSFSDESVSWSPDGKRIAVSSQRNGPFEIYVLDVNGENTLRLTNNVIPKKQTVQRQKQSSHVKAAYKGVADQYIDAMLKILESAFDEYRALYGIDVLRHYQAGTKISLSVTIDPTALDRFYIDPAVPSVTWGFVSQFGLTRWGDAAQDYLGTLTGAIGEFLLQFDGAPEWKYGLDNYFGSTLLPYVEGQVGKTVWPNSSGDAPDFLPGFLSQEASAPPGTYSAASRILRKIETQHGKAAIGKAIAELQASTDVSVADLRDALVRSTGDNGIMALFKDNGF